MARLDRFLVTDDWDGYFGDPVQSLLLRLTSNHFPVLLEGRGTKSRGPRPFRFENMWLKADNFMSLIRDWWQNSKVTGSSSFILVEKLKALKIKLKRWNKEVFGRVKENKKAALKRIAHWDTM